MPEATAALTVHQALAAVMGAVQAVKKRDRNNQQNYSFRGVDAVVNAVGPALRSHGVIVVPIAEEIATDHHYTTKNGANMRNVTLRIRWRIHGPAGDHIEAVTYGEAADSGDKAVSKAHSVALRTVLLQALCIPTDDPEPDAQAYERATPQDALPAEVVAARNAVKAAFADAHGFFSPEAAADQYRAFTDGKVLAEASAAELRKFAALLSMPEGSGPTEPATGVDKLSQKDRGAIFANLAKRGITEADDQRRYLGEVLGRELRSRSELTPADAGVLRAHFKDNPAGSATGPEGGGA